MSLVQECEILKIYGKEHKTIKKELKSGENTQNKLIVL